MEKQVPESTHEVMIIYTRPIYKTMYTINRAEHAYTLMKSYTDWDRIDLKEFFWVILLNRAGKVLGVSKIGEGDVSGVIVNNKEIFQLALLANASGIILVHNHPSGKLKPSKCDFNETEKVHKMAKIHSIELVDHIIITSENYFSFAENDLIE